MKKTTLLLLVALTVSVFAGTALRAQNVHLNVSVQTLDRTALTSATIYAAPVGLAYFVDAAHLMTSWTGSALELLPVNYTASTTLAINNTVDGESYVTGNVDSTTYASAIIVAHDAMNRCYVLASSNRQMLDTGYFYAAPLLASAIDGSFTASMLPSTSMLGIERAFVTDDNNLFYSNIDSALALCADSAVIFFLDTIALDHSLNITRPLTIRQAGKPIVSTYVGSALINVSGTTVSWFGNGTLNDVDMSAASGNLFSIDNAVFNLRQFGATAAGTPLEARNGSVVTIATSTLGSATATEAVVLNDSSNASISTLAVGSLMLVDMTAGSNGTLTVLDSTANVNVINADAYYFSGNYRKYRRTLTQTAAVANDVIFVARNIAASSNDTLNRRCRVNFNGNKLLGSLLVNNTSDTVFLGNGEVNYLEGIDGAMGTLVIESLDSVGTLVPGQLDVVIMDGRFSSIIPASGADVTVLGGKYNQRYDDYLAPRHAFINNTDADNGSFPWKVEEGYAVRFVNYNARIGQAGYSDSIAVVNTVDNRIVPAPSRPSYVGVDTILSAYFVNPEYTTPWNFLHDVLTSDTTLYAKWYHYDPLTDARYTVYHYRQDLDGTYPMTLCDSAFGVATLGGTLIVPANIYVGFTPNADADTTLSLADGAVINFYYTRDSFNVTYRLHGGMLAAGMDSVETYAFGETVNYPTVTRPGYTHTGWTPMPATMPAFDFTSNAVYSRNSYPLTWSHLDTTVVYNGNVVTDVTATYIDDNGGIVYALTTIVDAAGNPVSVARNAGVYTLTAVPADTNYQLSGTLWTTLTITAAPVTVNGLAVTTVKLYDGNANAEVTNMGTPSPVFGSDDLTVSTLARYDDATVGENKTITAYYTLGGVDANNYMLGSATEVVTTTGSIVAPMVYDGTQADNGIGVNASGYCSGDASGIDYYLQSGNPDQYKLVYSAEAHAQGFTDVNWSTITTAGTVDVNIPANAASGNYTVALTLRNSNYPQFESTPVNVTFHVNLSRNYTMPIFSDVISIVDTCHCIDHSTVKWYHNGVYVGDGPYYQEVGGLTGSYHVTMTMNNVDSRTCEQTDLTTIVPEASSVKTVVKAYPNPAIDRVNVSIEYSFETMHTLRVMNVLGMTLVNTTFDGESTVVDFSSFGVGSYTVIVDGVVTRVIKK